MDDRSTPAPAEPRPTWRDVLPPDYPEPALITREELLAFFREKGLPIAERSLRYWEAQGVLPRPVRRWHQGAVRSLYPAWYPPVVVAAAARIREQGESLQAVGADIPRIINMLGVMHWTAENRVVLLNDPNQTIGQLVQSAELAWGRPIDRVALTFLDTSTGDIVSSALYLPPTDSTKSRCEAKTEDRDD